MLKPTGRKQFVVSKLVRPVGCFLGERKNGPGTCYERASADLRGGSVENVVKIESVGSKAVP